MLENCNNFNIYQFKILREIHLRLKFNLVVYEIFFIKKNTPKNIAIRV